MKREITIRPKDYKQIATFCDICDINLIAQIPLSFGGSVEDTKELEKSNGWFMYRKSEFKGVKKGEKIYKNIYTLPIREIQYDFCFNCVHDAVFKEMRLRKSTNNQQNI